jgi:hypothetical protein
VMGDRTNFLLHANALSPLSLTFFLAELTTNKFDPFAIPYQDTLEALFLVGIFAFPLFIFSLVRDKRAQKRTSWRSQ